MAVAEQTPYIQYTGNGSTKNFSLTFDCEDAAHLIVKLNDSPAVTGWVLQNDSVVFTVAPAAGTNVSIQRNTPLSRTASYGQYDNSFRPPAINKDFDKIWLKLQELKVADWLLGQGIASEAVARIAADVYWDQMSQARDNDLKKYVNNILAGVTGQPIFEIPDSFIDAKQPYIGALGRTQHDKNKERISVRDFGAIGDEVLRPVTDWCTPGTTAYRGYADLDAIKAHYPHITSASDSIDWAAIQGAIDTRGAEATLYLDDGAYMVNRTITINKNYVCLIGGNPYTSRLIVADPTADTLVVTGFGVQINGIGFTTSTSRTGGWYVRLLGRFNVLNNFYMTWDYYGIESNGTNNRVTNGVMESGQGGGVRIKMGGGDTSQIIDGVLIGAQNAPYPRAGILLENNIALTISNTSIIQQGIDLLIEPGQDQSVSNLMVSNCFLDTSSNSCVIRPKAYTNGIVMQLYFNTTWFGSASAGGLIADNAYGGNIGGLYFTGSQFMHNNNGGMLLKGSVRGVYLANCLGANNNGAVLSMGDTVDDISISNSTLSSGGLQGPNDFGVYINNTPTNVKIMSTKLSNKAAAIGGNAQYATVIGCEGFISKQSGYAVVDSAATSLVIAHGLSAQPDPADIIISPQSSWGDAPLYLDTTSISSTHFTVRRSKTAPNAHFSWRAACSGA